MTYIDSVDTGGYPSAQYSVAAAHCAFFPDGKTAAVANCKRMDPDIDLRTHN